MERRECQEQLEFQRQRNATIIKAQPIARACAIFLVKSHNVILDTVILTSFIYLTLGDGKTRTSRAVGATETKECYNH